MLHSDLTQTRFGGMLEAVLTSSIWCQQRLHEFGCADSPMCRRCGLAQEDEAHRYWTCIGNRTCDDPRIQSTQHLRHVALASPELTCFYMRGVPVASQLACIPEPPAECCVFSAGAFATPGRIAGGTFGTDGTGGVYTSDARLRRCAWAIAQIRPGGSGDVLGVLFGALPCRQTVPRSELWALVQLLERLCPASPATVYLDCLPVFKAYSKGREHCLYNSQMSDMWSQFWALHAERLAPLRLGWVPSHKSAQEACELDLPLDAVAANTAADTAATFAASQCQLSPWYANAVREHDSLVVMVQDRLAAINMELLSRFGPLRRSPAPPRQVKSAAARLHSLLDVTTLPADL